jgi:maleate isomerase
MIVPMDAVGHACLVAITATGDDDHRGAETGSGGAGDGVPLLTSAGALVDEWKKMDAIRIARVLPYAMPSRTTLPTTSRRRGSQSPATPTFA